MFGSLPSTPLLLHLRPPWLAWAHLYRQHHDLQLLIMPYIRKKAFFGMYALQDQNFAWQILNCFLFACSTFYTSILPCNISCKLSIKAQQKAFAEVLSAFSSSDVACVQALWACYFVVTAAFQQPVLQTHRTGALQSCCDKLA